MNLKDFIDTMTRAKRGVKPAYTRYHVLKCLLLIHQDEPIGRIKLSKTLRLGETTVRTLLNRLKEEQIINVDKIGGVYLVGKGKILLRTIFSILEDIQKVKASYTEKIMPQYNYVYSLKLKVPLQQFNIKLTELRDMIIRFGADAALILKVDHGKLCLPYDNTIICEDSYEALRYLRKGLKIIEAKTILFAFSSKSEDIAEKALIETFIELLTNNIIII